MAQQNNPDCMPKKRAPFKAWRCLFKAKEATDPTKTMPFAWLEVRVEKAVKLIPADWNIFGGKSDPYVTLSLNGAKKPKLADSDDDCEPTPRGDQLSHTERANPSYQISKTISRTLAPTWDETFWFDIYHPMSAISLKVYDEDIVGADDFLGWLDINLGGLPFNEPCDGWFDLRHPDAFHTCCAGDPPQAKDHIGAGRIHLHLKLQTSVQYTRRNEFFAMTLPQPPHPVVGQHKPGGFDLGHLVGQMTLLQKRVTHLIEELKKGIEFMERLAYPWVVCVVGLALTWHPTFIVPALVVVIALIYSGSAEAEEEDTALEDAQIEADKKREEELNKQRSATGMVSRGMNSAMERVVSLKREMVSTSPSGRKVTRTERVDYQEPLLSGSNSVPKSSAAAGRNRKHKTISDLEKSDLDRNKKLNMMSSLVPPDFADTLQDVDENVMNILKTVTLLDKMIFRSSWRPLVTLFFVSLVVVLVFFRDFQEPIIQYVVSIVIAKECLNRSVTGQLYKACRDFASRKAILRMGHRDQEDHHFIIGEVSRDGSRAHSVHELESLTLTKPTKCGVCECTILGFISQAKQCQNCAIIVCPSCELSIANNCIGAPTMKQDDESWNVLQRPGGIFGMCCKGPADLKIEEIRMA